MTLKHCICMYIYWQFTSSNHHQKIQVGHCCTVSQPGGFTHMSSSIVASCCINNFPLLNTNISLCKHKSYTPSIPRTVLLEQVRADER